jgi:hypothetical protein
MPVALMALWMTAIEVAGKKTGSVGTTPGDKFRLTKIQLLETALLLNPNTANVCF